MAKEALEVQEGKRINYTLAALVNGGDVIPYGTGMCVIATTSGLPGEVIACETGKAWQVNAATADAIAEGDALYFDAINRVLTITAAGNSRFGRALSVKAAATAGTVLAKLNAV